MTKLVIPERNIMTILSGVGSFTVLSAVLCGAPILLATVMPSPIPSRWPSFADLVSRALSPSAAHVWMLLLSMLGWLAWLWFAAVIAIEAVSLAKGMKAPRVPGARVGQNLAAWLVGSVALLVLLHAEGQGFARGHVPVWQEPVSISAVWAGSNAPTELAGMASTLLGGTAGTPYRVASGGTVQQQEPQQELQQEPQQELQRRELGTYKVRPGDTLWSIASRQLSDPLRWVDIARLNYARPQPDGGALTSSHWVQPGWVLVMPEAEPFVSKGQISHEATSRGTQPSARPLAPAPPNSPPQANAAPAGVKTDEGAGCPGAAGREAHRAGPVAGSVSGGSGAGGGGLPLVPIGGSLVGLGVIATLDHMRRAQQRHRKRGRSIRLPDAELLEVERRLRSNKDREALTVIAHGLEVLGSSIVAKPEGAIPAVVGARLSRTVLEVMIDDRCWPPRATVPPFVSRPGSSSWFVERRSLAASASADAGRRNKLKGAAFPGLVSIGRDASGLVLVNLEAAGSMAMSGPRDLVVGTLAGMALELASSPWAYCADICLVGFGSKMPDLERITTFETVSQVIAHLELLASDSEKLLDASGFSRCDLARICCGDAGWEPTIVLCAEDLSRAEVDELVEVAGDGSFGVAVVVAAQASPARWTAEVTGEELQVEPLGVAVHPQPLGDHDLRSIGRLLDLACEVSDSGDSKASGGYGIPSGSRAGSGPLPALGTFQSPSGARNGSRGTPQGDEASSSPPSPLVRAVTSVFSRARKHSEAMMTRETATVSDLARTSKADGAPWIIDDPCSLGDRIHSHALVPRPSLDDHALEDRPPCGGLPLEDRPLQEQLPQGQQIVAGRERSFALSPSLERSSVAGIAGAGLLGGGSADDGHPARCAPVPVRLAPVRPRPPDGDHSDGDFSSGGLSRGDSVSAVQAERGRQRRGEDGGSGGVPLRAARRREAPARTDVEVEVAILGPVEIRGAERPMRRAGATELVVYLAMHSSGVASDAWATAIWPDRVMAPSSLHSTASEARRALGRSQSGEDHLPRQHGRLRLAPTVGSDWQRFLDLAEQGSPMCLEEAISLVRGEAFQGLRAVDWTVLEGFAASIEAKVVDVATSLAEHFLELGDASGAEWAARLGLKASHYDERLYRVLMRAADAAGNPAGVERVMDELMSVVAEEVEPYDMVHPETAALYARLARGRRATALQQRATSRVGTRPGQP